MITRMLAYTAALALPATALAQTLNNVTVEPAQIQAGGSTTITVNFEPQDNINCGLRLHFGDGTTQDYKINQKRDLALKVPRAYSRPGTYQVMAEPKTVGLLLKCGGKNQGAVLKVAAPAQAAAPAESKAAARVRSAEASPCPEGWTLDRRSAKKKDGSFTCKAPTAGTKPPARITCPGDLTYFENVRKGVMGCRP